MITFCDAYINTQAQNEFYFHTQMSKSLKLYCMGHNSLIVLVKVRPVH